MFLNKPVFYLSCWSKCYICTYFIFFLIMQDCQFDLVNLICANSLLSQFIIQLACPFSWYFGVLKNFMLSVHLAGHLTFILFISQCTFTSFRKAISRIAFHLVHITISFSVQVKLEGDINQGVAYYKKALFYNWHYADAMYNLGVAYGEMLKFEMVSHREVYSSRSLFTCFIANLLSSCY